MRGRFLQRVVAALALCWLVAGAAPAAGQATSPLAVVTHPGVQVDNLTLAELRRLLLGDREFWPSGARVVILIRAPIARERDAVVRGVCDMTEAQFRTHWIGKVFRAETPSGPRIVSSTSAALEQVRGTPGAITFVDLASVGPGVKVLTIDGKRPTDPAYRFR
jgi:hypothetical protein